MAETASPAEAGKVRADGSTATIASAARRAWWRMLHFLCFILFVPLYRYRSYDVARIPAVGPVVLLSNHQSHLDPIIVGLGAHGRPFYALARQSLFNHSIVAWLIRSLNAIPVARGRGDTSAMKRCVEVLRDGKMLVIFPEGTRTPDGGVRPFEPGTMLLIRRAKPTVVPVALDGSFDAWPRGRALPRPWGHIGVIYGQPIPADELLAMEPAAALDMLRQRVEALHGELVQRMARR